MLGSGFKAERLRVNLRLVINRLKLLEKKKSECGRREVRVKHAPFLACCCWGVTGLFMCFEGT